MSISKKDFVLKYKQYLFKDISIPRTTAHRQEKKTYKWINKNIIQVNDNSNIFKKILKIF